MGQEERFLATLVIQDGMRDISPSLGLRYLLQIDTEKKGGRFFVDITAIVTRIKLGNLPDDGEWYVDGSLDNPDRAIIYVEK